MNIRLTKISFLYLLCVPIVVTALAFIVGHVSYKIYIPVWILNMVTMMLAMQRLAATHGEIFKDTAKYFIFPWMLFSIFGGMGPPPETASSWAALYLEQVFRYTFLIFGGISIATGFFQLRKALAGTAGKHFAKVGSVLIAIALPFFIFNMVYWGYFLTNIFITYAVPGASAKPEWLRPLAQIFTMIRMLEVALIYLGTATFTIALKITQQLSYRATILYVSLACFAAVMNLLPSSIDGALAVANYLSIIPAITMLMPYFIAVNLLGKSINTI